MIKAWFGSLMGIILIIVGIILISLPTTSWQGSTVQDGFQILKTLNVYEVLINLQVGLTLKIGVGLAVYAGPIFTFINVVVFFVNLFIPTKTNSKQEKKPSNWKNFFANKSWFKNWTK